MSAVVITGAGSGIGRACAMRLLRDGWAVVVTDINPEAAEATVELAHVAGFGDRVTSCRVDVRDESSVAEAVAAAVATFGSLGAMVNNAGIGGAFGPIHTIEQADWDFTFEVLVRGVFFGIKHAVTELRKGGGGAIVNVASAAAFSGGFGPAPYSAAKAAVVNLTRAAATELAPELIRVNAVAPGAVVTAMTDGGDPDESKSRFAASQPWPEAGSADHIAAAVAYLAGDDSRFVNGETLVVDGGLVAAGPGRGYAERMRTDPGRRGLSGISYGSTGTPAVVRRRESSPYQTGGREAR